MNPNKKYVLLFIVVAIIVGIFAVNILLDHNKQPVKSGQHVVAAVYPVTVDAFVRFQEGVTKILKKRGVDVYFFSAEGDPSRFQTVVNSALLKKPDVLILVGTQLTNIGLAPSYEKRLPKVVSSCISDTTKVEQLVSVGIDPPRKKPVAIISDTPRQDPYKYGTELIIRIFPKMKKIGILFNNAEINSKNTATKMAEALKLRGVNILNGIVSGEEDVEKVTRNLIMQGAELIIIPHDKFVIKKAATVVKIGMDAPGKPIPVFSLDDGTVRKDGAAFGVSVDYGYIGEITAETCLKIIDGEAPDKMPVIIQENANSYFNEDKWIQLGLPGIPDDIKMKSIVF